MAGVRYERPCSGCGETTKPYGIYPVDLNVKPLFDEKSVWTERFVALYGCDKCNLLNMFEIDSVNVRYFQDLERAKSKSDIFNPTWECKDCGHGYEYHSDLNCLGINEKDGQRLQNCKCYKFSFVLRKKDDSNNN